MGDDLGLPLIPVGRICMDFEGKRKKQRGSVADSRRQQTLVFVFLCCFFFLPLDLTAQLAHGESIRSHSAPGSPSPP